MQGHLTQFNSANTVEHCLQQVIGPQPPSRLHLGPGRGGGVHHQPGPSTCQAQETQGPERVRNFPKVTEPRGGDLVKVFGVDEIFTILWVHTG